MTAIQVDSEQEGTEIELTSCSSYSRPDMNLQDSTEVRKAKTYIVYKEKNIYANIYTPIFLKEIFLINKRFMENLLLIKNYILI